MASIHTQVQNKRALATPAPAQTGVVAVVGLGYVGLPLAIRAASKGFTVIGFDIDDVKVAQLARREASFLSPEDAAQFKRAPTLSVTADERDLALADVFIVCVPTPVHDNRLPNLRPLGSACVLVGAHMREGTLVIIESTVSPGVCEEYALPRLERASGLSRTQFDFAHCPERINPGDERWDVRTIPRVVGASTPKALERATALYRTLVDAPIMPMGSIKEAEAVKMMENSFRDVNIAFINELAIAFDRAGIDIVNVIRGASTKPFGFMAFYPGCGVGGHCIPVDPYYLIRYGRRNGFEHKLLVAARHVNNEMPRYTVHVLENALRRRGKKVSSATVALLGLAYKPDTPDVRESPAHEILELLEAKGALVRTFDPYVLGTAATLSEALRSADAAVIATGHNLFRTLTPGVFLSHKVGIVVDGRNCLDKDAFAASKVVYRGIGRG